MEIYIKDFNKNDCISGIYAIESKKTNKVYIGRAKNLYTRYSVHLSELRRGKHYSGKLQKEFKEFGESNFSYIILMKCPLFLCIDMESNFQRCIPYSERLDGGKIGKYYKEDFIERYNDSRIGSIYIGHRIILQQYKEWLEDDEYGAMSSNEFLMQLIFEGIKLYERNYANCFKDIYNKYSNKTNFMDYFLDYAALTILEKILNWKNNKAVYFETSKFSKRYHFCDKTLICNILDNIKKNDECLDDLITANSIYYLNLWEIESEEIRCKNDKYDLYKISLLYKNKIQSLFDLLYYYILYINATSYFKDVNMCSIGKSSLKLNWKINKD